MEERSSNEKEHAGPHVVSKMRVDGFWKESELFLDFDRHVNFLIGPNGAGKTTIVNLLSAILRCDLRALDRIDFHTASLTLASEASPEESIAIDVSKAQERQHLLPEINYKITDHKGQLIAEYSLDEIEERLSIRDPRYYSRRRLLAGNAVQQKLADMIDLSWLPVHRHDSHPGDRNELGGESPVDLKLDAQANQLVRYFSKLDQRSATAFNDFQKSVFLSLLSGQEGPSDLFSASDFDIGRAKDALVPILEKFKIQKSRYQSKVDRHFEVLASATEKTSNEGYSSDEVVAMVNQRRIEEVVKEWKETTTKQAKIYKMRDGFVRILNQMFINKDVRISATNEIVISVGRDRPMAMRALSSGEKQLLIIMGQALLQDCRPTTFIADEPELSLHVLWQERLVECVRELNPAAQIIFATHSPDIVGKYLDRVIDVSKVLAK